MSINELEYGQMQENDKSNELIVSINSKKNSVGIFSQPGQVGKEPASASEVDGYYDEFQKINQEAHVRIDNDTAEGGGIF